MSVEINNESGYDVDAESLVRLANFLFESMFVHPEAEPKVLALGARRLPGEGGDFRVYADPVGHPFCLVWDA